MVPPSTRESKRDISSQRGEGLAPAVPPDRSAAASRARNGSGGRPSNGKRGGEGHAQAVALLSRLSNACSSSTPRKSSGFVQEVADRDVHRDRGRPAGTLRLRFLPKILLHVQPKGPIPRGVLE